MNKRSLNQVFKGFLVGVIFSVIGYLLTFLFRVVVARYFGPESYGIYTLLQTILRFLWLFALMGLVHGIPRYFPVYFYDRKYSLLRGYLFTAFTIPFVLSVVFAVSVALAAPWLNTLLNYPDSFTILLQVFAITLPFRVLSVTLRSLFRSQKRIFYDRFIKDVAENGFMLAAGVGAFVFKLGLFELIAGVVLAQILTTITAYLFVKAKIRLPKGKKKEFRFKEWFGFSIPLLFTGFFSYVMTLADNFVIGVYLPPTELGIYSVAFSLGLLITFFQPPFFQIFLPVISGRYAKKSYDEIDFLYRKTLTWLFSFSIPILLVMVFFARHIIVIFFGVEYVSGATALIILSCSFWISVLTGISNHILTLYKKTVKMFLIYVTTGTANLILNLLLVPRYGIEGAAVASAISFISTSVWAIIAARKYSKGGIDLIYVAKFIVAGIPSITVALWVFRLFTNTYVAAICAGTVYVLLYVFFLLVLRTVKKEDIEVIKNVEKQMGVNLDWLNKLLKRFS